MTFSAAHPRTLSIPLPALIGPAALGLPRNALAQTTYTSDNPALTSFSRNVLNRFSQYSHRAASVLLGSALSLIVHTAGPCGCAYRCTKVSAETGRV